MKEILIPFFLMRASKHKRESQNNTTPEENTGKNNEHGVAGLNPAMRGCPRFFAQNIKYANELSYDSIQYRLICPKMKKQIITQ